MATKCDDFHLYLIAFTGDELDTITHALYEVGECELADEIETQVAGE